MSATRDTGAGRETVTVRVPGSTSNCGAGFDTLGLALKVYNRITLTRLACEDGASPGSETARSGGVGVDGSGGLANDGAVTPWAAAVSENDRRALALVNETAAGFFRATGVSWRRFSFHIEGDVPPARGLGSSATIITGVLVGLDALHGTGWSRQRLAALATALEGNPDNVSPSLLGGFTVSRCDPATGAYLDTIRVPVPDEVVFIVASPALETITRESRGALPLSLSHRDAARSVNSAAYLTAAFATGDFEKLRHAVGDFLHEPYRLPKIPGANAALRAGIEAGALTGWLSGSGSSVLCVAYRAREETVEAVTRAMAEAFARAGLNSEVRVLGADNDGLRVVAE